jgi:hypothetical protein
MDTPLWLSCRAGLGLNRPGLPAWLISAEVGLCQHGGSTRQSCVSGREMTCPGSETVELNLRRVENWSLAATL